MDNCAIYDFEHFAEAFNRSENSAIVADIHDLVFDGNSLKTKNGEQIDAIYKRVTLDDLYARQNEEGVSALINAVKAQAVCSID